MIAVKRSNFRPGRDGRTAGAVDGGLGAGSVLGGSVLGSGDFFEISSWLLAMQVHPPLSDCRTPQRGFRAASLHYSSNYAMQSTANVARHGPLARGISAAKIAARAAESPNLAYQYTSASCQV